MESNGFEAADIAINQDVRMIEIKESNLNEVFI